MVQFWLAAPSDQLEALLGEPLGSTTQALVRQLTPDTSFTTEQVAFRNAVGQHLAKWVSISPDSPTASGCVFGVPPGLFKIANAEASCPIGWRRLILSYMNKIARGSGGNSP